MAFDSLNGLKIAFLVTDSFEQVEMTEPRSAALGRNPTRHSIPISDWLYWLPIKAKPPQPSGRNAMEPFISKHAQAIIGTLSGFDRRVFRGTLRYLAHCAGMSSYLWTMGVLLKDFATFAQDVTERLKEASQALARRIGR